MIYIGFSKTSKEIDGNGNRCIDGGDIEGSIDKDCLNGDKDGDRIGRKRWR